MPTRYLKPGIRDSERIEAIKSPDAEILFYRLLSTVDDFGRFDARGDMVKAACFPIRKRATADKCIQWLHDLEKARLLGLYEVDGKPYLQLAKWDNKPRAGKSKFPDPPADVYKRMQMLPVTETETETGTDIARCAQSLELTIQDLIALGVDEQAAKDWLFIRKKKKTPLTKTALEGVEREAAKAGITLAQAVKICATKPWVGFNSAWDWRDGLNGEAIAKSWWETSTGIEKKGVELGIDPNKEAFPFFKAKVFAAAGDGPWNQR